MPGTNIDFRPAGSAAANHNLDSSTHLDVNAMTNAKGDLMVWDSANTRWDRLPVGSNDQVLTADSAQSLGVKWAAAAGGGAPTTAQYVTLAVDATLTAERVLTGTANQITITDNGAGSTVVLSTPQDIATSSTPTFGGMTLSGNLDLTGNDTTVETAQESIRAGATAGDLFLDARHDIIVNIDSNNNGADAVFAVRANAVATDVFSVSEAGLGIFGDIIQAGDGAAGGPTYGFTTDPDTGMFLASDGNLDFSVGGTARTRMTTTEFRTAVNIGFGSLVTGTDFSLTRVSTSRLDIDAQVRIEDAQAVLYAQNTTDGVSNQVAFFSGGNRATAANNDEAYLTFRLENDSGNQTELVRFTWKVLDVQDASKDSRPEFQYYTANTLRELVFPAITADDTVAVLGLAQTFSDQITFTATATLAGINVGSNAGEPSSPTNGDIVYDSTANQLKGYANGAWVDLGAAGGGGAPTNAQYVTLATDATLSAERVLTGTANQITITDNGAGSTVVLSTPQDIHTGASPTFAGGTFTGDVQFTANILIENPAATFDYTIVPAAIVADRTFNLPLLTGTDTIVGEAHTATLTNKTIDGDNNTISNLAHGAEVDEPSSGVHGVTGTVVGTSDTQTLTNKTIDSDNNTITNIVDADIKAGAEIAVAKLADGAARQLLQTDAGGTAVEWTSNVDVPGTLDVTGAAVLDSTLSVADTVTLSSQNSIQLDPYNTGAGQTAEVRWLELAANGTHYVAFKAPDAMTASVTYVWPDADGSSDQVLTTNASGVLSWTTKGGGAGSNTLDEAYDQGGAGAGRTITADSNAVRITATSVGGDDLLDVEHVASGTLTANTTNTVELKASRTHTAATTVTDNFDTILIQRTNVMNNASGTLNAQGSLLKLENVATQTAGTLSDTAVVLEISQDADATGNIIEVYEGSDANPQFALEPGGVLRWGAGGGTAMDITIQRGAANVLNLLDQFKVDYAGTGLIVENTTDAASNQIAIFRSDNATRADNDEIYLTFSLDDDGGSTTEFVRFTAKALDVTAASKDSRPELQYYTANTLRELVFPAITADDTVVVLDLAQTLTNKTLTSPTINTPTIPATEWTNANHDHSAANAGGTIALSDTTGTLAISRGGTGETANPEYEIYISAAAMKGLATAGGGDADQLPEDRELATNDIHLDYIAFDQTTEEHVAFWYLLPKGWDDGTITATFYWTAASGSGGVTWGFAARAFADNDALDQALGTEVDTDDTLITADDLHISPESSAITIGGTPSDTRRLTYIAIARKVADANDTLTADAQLLGVQLNFTRDSYTDA